MPIVRFDGARLGRNRDIIVKLGTFSRPAGPYLGVINQDDNYVLDLAAASLSRGPAKPYFCDMLQLMKAGEEALGEAARLAAACAGDPRLCIALSDAKFLPPVPIPEQIRDMSLFPQHICAASAGMKRIATQCRNLIFDSSALKPLSDVPDIFKQQPIFYFHNRHNVVGHDATVVWPNISKIMDFELGFGMFIGRDGENISLEGAEEYIFGYSVYNDFSARDLQFDETQSGFGPAKSKSFDGANAIGPWVVTRDEIPEPRALELSVTVNGDLWGRSNSSGMLHSVQEIITYLSRDETLKAGEFIGFGTVGFGCGLELGRYLQDGDIVELYVEKIGRLRNRVVRKKE